MTDAQLVAVEKFRSLLQFVEKLPPEILYIIQSHPQLQAFITREDDFRAMLAGSVGEQMVSNLRLMNQLLEEDEHGTKDAIAEALKAVKAREQLMHDQAVQQIMEKPLEIEEAIDEDRLSTIIIVADDPHHPTPEVLRKRTFSTVLAVDFETTVVNVTGTNVRLLNTIDELAQQLHSPEMTMQVFALLALQLRRYGINNVPAVLVPMIRGWLLSLVNSLSVIYGLHRGNRVPVGLHPDTQALVFDTTLPHSKPRIEVLSMVPILAMVDSLPTGVSITMDVEFADFGGREEAVKLAKQWLAGIKIENVDEPVDPNPSDTKERVKEVIRATRRERNANN